VEGEDREEAAMCSLGTTMMDSVKREKTKTYLVIVLNYIASDYCLAELGS
jgi:hypothetical protein